MTRVAWLRGEARTHVQECLTPRPMFLAIVPHIGKGSGNSYKEDNM